MMSINALEEELKLLKEISDIFICSGIIATKDLWNDRIRALENEIFERQVLVNPETTKG